MSRSDARRGFTLIELLVVIAIITAHRDPAPGSGQGPQGRPPDHLASNVASIAKAGAISISPSARASCP